MRSAALPEELQRFVDEQLEERTATDLRRSAGELSARYRASTASGPAARSADDIAAYAATRLPATYAAVAVALDELLRAGFAPVSQLDLGTGLGSAVWAAAIGVRRLAPARHGHRRGGRDAADGGRRRGDLAVGRGAARRVAARRRGAGDAGRAVRPGDGVVRAERAAQPAAALALLSRVWSQTSGALVLVEPGTPADYERMMVFRRHLIGLGATILAPCPHDLECPMRNDWCHFAVRLPRSAAHRAAKGAKRGFEDEKFTYVVAVRAADPDRGAPRILRHPLVRPGHVRFQLCDPSGELREQTVARSDPGYRTARKLSWGDRFEE